MKYCLAVYSQQYTGQDILYIVARLSGYPVNTVRNSCSNDSILDSILATVY
jgi:hypothetical protein